MKKITSLLMLVFLMTFSVLFTNAQVNTSESKDTSSENVDSSKTTTTPAEEIQEEVISEVTTEEAEEESGIQVLKKKFLICLVVSVRQLRLQGRYILKLRCLSWMNPQQRLGHKKLLWLHH